MLRLVLILFFLSITCIGSLSNSAFAAKIGVGILSMGIESQLTFEGRKEFKFNELNALKVYSLSSHAEVCVFDHDQSELRRFREIYSEVASSDPLLAIMKMMDNPSGKWGLMSKAVGQYVRRALTRASTKMRHLDLAIEAWSGATAIDVLVGQLHGHGEEIQVLPINPGLEYFGLGPQMGRTEFFALKSRLKKNLISEEDQRMIDSYRQVLVQANVKVVNVAQDLNEERIYRELSKRVRFVSSSNVREMARLYVQRAQRFLRELANDHNIVFVVNTGRRILTADKNSFAELDLDKRQDGWFREGQDNILVVGAYNSEGGQIEKAKGYCTSSQTQVCAPILAKVRHSHEQIREQVYEYSSGAGHTSKSSSTSTSRSNKSFSFTLSAVTNSYVANQIALQAAINPEMSPIQAKDTFLRDSTQICSNLVEASQDGRYFPCAAEYDVQEKTHEIEALSSPPQFSLSLF